MINLQSKIKNIKGEVKIGGSKSESNRLLILQALSTDNFKIENLSNSKDTELMLAALSNTKDIIDIGMAGTAMRFLTSFLAISEGREVTLTGSDRMKKRPIGELVESLISLGADIEYKEEVGFPPLLIKGKKLKGGKITLNSSVSSQFITSLMLIGSQMEKGIEISLKGKVVSKPYIEMTVELLKRVNINAEFNNKKIRIPKGDISSDIVQTVESDWSSASYHFSIAAISNESDIILNTYKRDSFQGDSELVNIYKEMGVETIFLQNKIRLQKTDSFEQKEYLEFNLIEQPDIAQTIAVTCFALDIDCKLTGLETLRIKETDRLFALKVELEKLGAEVKITNSTLELKSINKSKSGVEIETYDDHRMAMAFAPLALINPLFILDPKVVDKSYPDFWQHMNQLGIETTEK